MSELFPLASPTWRSAWRAIATQPRCWGAFAFALCASLLIGCVGSVPLARPPLPLVLDNEGLVVAEVIKEGPLQSMAVMIDGSNAGAIVNGFIVIPLPAGAHVFDELFASFGSWTETFPINRPFRVERGQVTNLGLLALTREPSGGPGSTRFDNQQDMQHFLNAFYPSLARAMPMHRAQIDFSSREVLEALRREVLSRRHLEEASRFLGTNARASRPRYMVGDLGAVAELEYDPLGRPVAKRLIDVSTVSRVAAEASVADRSVFLTESGRLFLVQSGEVTERGSPPGLRHPRLAMGGESDLIVVDDQREVYISPDNGQSWRAFTGIMTAHAELTGVASGDRGYYIYQDHPPSVLYSTYRALDLKEVPIPHELDHLGLVRETPRGLVIESPVSSSDEGDPRPFFVRANNRSDWQKRWMPGLNCSSPTFLDDIGDLFATSCAEHARYAPRITYLSFNGGRTWSRQ